MQRGRSLYPVIGVVFLCLSMLVGGYFSFFHHRDYIIFSVSFDKNARPIIKTRIEDSIYQFEIWLGSKYSLSLSQTTLDHIRNKKLQGVASWKDIKGVQHEAPSYVIPKIHLNTVTLRNVLAHEYSDIASQGHLGKILGGEFNVLLDFPRARIIACDTFNKLKIHKFVDATWLQCPLKLGKLGAIIEVETDFGTKRLQLQTTAFQAAFCTSTLHESPHWTHQDYPYVHSSRLIIGNKDFGGLNFAVYDITNELDDMDGILAMEFLRQHAIYLDYKHQIAYIEPPKEYFVTLPVAFNSANLPCLATTIGDTSCLCMLDLGSDAPFSLDPIILEPMDKEFIATIPTFDFKGHEHMQPLFKIPTIKVGELVFAEPEAKQVNPEFHVNTKIVDHGAVHVFGSIGVPILEKYNLCLDFQRSVVYAASSLAQVKANGLLHGHVIQIPFTTAKGLIVLNIETDLGEKRFVLDTGVTCSTINASLVKEEQIVKMKRTGLDCFDSQQFVIRGQDFGWQRMVCLKIGSVFQCDGFLGMDFLRDHTLYIDYPNRIIYLEVPSSEEKAQ